MTIKLLEEDLKLLKERFKKHQKFIDHNNDLPAFVLKERYEKRNIQLIYFVSPLFIALLIILLQFIFDSLKDILTQSELWIIIISGFIIIITTLLGAGAMILALFYIIRMEEDKNEILLFMRHLKEGKEKGDEIRNYLKREITESVDISIQDDRKIGKVSSEE